MIYLSSRAIGQSHSTKSYLQRVAQGTKSLPDGPVLLSPTSVLSAFRKEVIERKPYEFKIDCLSNLKQLFPSAQPLYAGFGNRETDVKSYDAVGIPFERIFTIDPTGSVMRADKIGFTSSYASMATDAVDVFFPPINDSNQSQLANTKKFSTFNYWRTPSEADDNCFGVDLLAYESQRKAAAASQKKRSRR
jgi:phosphatidate phosphatase LPIN